MIFTLEAAGEGFDEEPGAIIIFASSYASSTALNLVVGLLPLLAWK